MEVLVIGLGRFGTSVATTLANKGISVSVVDKDEQKVNEISDIVDNAFILNSTDEKALRQISIEHFDKVVVCLGKTALNDSLMTCLNLKELEIDNIIAKASSLPHFKLLKKIGIDHIVQPEDDMGRKVAIKISGNCLIDYVELSSDIKIDNVLVNNKMKKFYGKSIQEINLRKKFQVNIISIQRADDIIIPDSNTQILENDTLIIIGKNEKINKFESEFKLV
ncbi:MAG: potassium channel family protein [Mycoplasmatales bacterium]